MKMRNKGKVHHFIFFPFPFQHRRRPLPSPQTPPRHHSHSSNLSLCKRTRGPSLHAHQIPPINQQEAPFQEAVPPQFAAPLRLRLLPLLHQLLVPLGLLSQPRGDSLNNSPKTKRRDKLAHRNKPLISSPPKNQEIPISSAPPPPPPDAEADGDELAPGVSGEKEMEDDYVAAPVARTHKWAFNDNLKVMIRSW